MVDVPAAMPLTTPPGDVMVATPGVLLVHVPPVTLLESVVLPAMQVLSTPLKVPAVAEVVTVISFVANTVPHEVFTV